jgi:hypothetical protein
MQQSRHVVVGTVQIAPKCGRSWPG